METEKATKRAGLQVVSFASCIVWLLVIPLCPTPITQILPGNLSASFLGCFLLGCSFVCAARMCFPSGKVDSHLNQMLLPAGILLACVAMQLPVTHTFTGTCVAGIIAGWGEGSLLLAWGQTLAQMSTRRACNLISNAVICASIIGLSLVAFKSYAIALWALLIVLALSACLPFSDAIRQANKQIKHGTEYNAASNAGMSINAQPSEQSDVVTTNETGRRNLPALFFQLWEPSVGLGLSIMSAVLPWGSLFSNTGTSLPAYWSFALGIILLCISVLIACKRIQKNIDFQIASHIIIPILAAAVVGLRMLGDLDQIGVGASAFKGIGSGAASAGFFFFALIALTHASHAAKQSADVFALGLGIACLIGFATLPLHIAHQQFASLVAPLLSLVFLVASCCSSVFHIRSHASSHEPKPLSIEEAANKICLDYSLSPRERQVMEQLVLGRSAERIGAVLGIFPNTVRSHVGNIHTKLSISSRDDLADLLDSTMHSETNKLPAK